MDGQVYVTVEAQATTYSATAVGSGGGSVSGGFRIDWTYGGGFSGVLGWAVTPKLPNGGSLPTITITPDPNSVENTNQRSECPLSTDNYYLGLWKYFIKKCWWYNLGLQSDSIKVKFKKVLLKKN